MRKIFIALLSEFTYLYWGRCDGCVIRNCRIMFSIWAKQRPIPSISAFDSSKFQFISASGRFGRTSCLFFMARIQYSHRSSASTVSFSVRQLPNAPFVLSCPIRSFRKLNSRARKNWTPETQCLALFQKNFVLFTCRLILRFPHFFHFSLWFFFGGDCPKSSWWIYIRKV